MYLKMYKKYWAALSCLLWVTSSINAQTDSLFLTVDQLFERGVQYNLQLQADAMKESMAQERMRTARSAQLPELQIGLKGGFVGQPVVWERGLSDPVYPEHRTGHKTMQLILRSLSIRVVKSEALFIKRI